jgi:hypothetical protein
MDHQKGKGSGVEPTCPEIPRNNTSWHHSRVVRFETPLPRKKDPSIQSMYVKRVATLN